AFTDKEEIELSELNNLVLREEYSEALNRIERLNKSQFKKLAFLWREPKKRLHLELPQITIRSLLRKGDQNRLGVIELQALRSALAPPDESLPEYLDACRDKNSITAWHFKLMQMHVNKPSQNKVINAVLAYGRYKGLLRE
ncbi:MAG: hypothetical protein ACPG5T_03850, partial [Endozoicomonas sp.]